MINKLVNMKKIETIILIILAGLITVNINAQNNNSDKIEIGVSGSAGMSALNFTPINGNSPSYGFGYDFGWDIAFLFSEQLSFRTGVNLASYKSSISIEEHSVRHQIQLPIGIPIDGFYMIAEYTQYEELFEAFFIRFPLMVQYQMGSKQNFYVAAGLYVGLPLNSFSQINADQLVTKGYSEYTMQYYEKMPNHGFDTYTDIKSGSKLDLGLSLSAALEAGLKWNIKNGMLLYTGIFADFGLNNIRKGDSMEESVFFNEDEKSFKFNSILHSQTEGKPLTDKVKPNAFGLKIRLSLTISK